MKETCTSQLFGVHLPHKQRLFMAACNERLEELVKLGMLPEKFAEDRRQSAALIEEGLSDNPEEQGREFGEIGLEGISAFRRAVDEAVEKATTQVQPYLDLVHDLITRFEADGKQEKVRAVQDVLGNIETGLDQFRETAKQIKDLEVPFAELNKQIIDLGTSEKDIQGIQNN